MPQLARGRLGRQREQQPHQMGEEQRRHRHRADTKCVGTRRAGVLDACARDAGETDRSRHGVAADAFLTPQGSALRCDEGRLDLLRLETLVDRFDRRGECARGHGLVTLVEEFTHLDEAGTHDGDFVPRHQTLSSIGMALKP